MKYHGILVIFSFVIGCNSINFRIKNFGLSKCSPKYQPVEFYNVRVAMNRNRDFVFSGTMSSQVDIESPVRVAVELKKLVLGIWIWVGCYDNVGSCIYKDVCSYGLPNGQTCPKYLNDNNIPCRCPVPKGNYTIPTTFTVRRDKEVEHNKRKIRRESLHQTLQSKTGMLQY